MNSLRDRVENDGFVPCAVCGIYFGVKKYAVANTPLKNAYQVLCEEHKPMEPNHANT